MTPSLIEITPDTIDVNKIMDAAQSPDCGAATVFLGTVRNFSRGKDILRLEYEAFPEMAENKIAEIVEEASAKWDLRKAAISHRVGSLDIGETAVAIAVATPHRQDGFAACQYIIDRLKQVVPIWKKEIAIDGETWIDDHA